MAFHFTLFLLCTSLVLLPLVTLFEINFKTVDECRDEKKFFQISNLQCGDCEEPGTGKATSVDGLFCTCGNDYFITSYFGGPTVNCNKCPPNEVPSEDKRFCIACVSGYRPDKGRCNDCSSNEFAVDRNLNGTRKGRRECISCSTTSGGTILYPMANEPFCKYCPSCSVTVPAVTNQDVYKISYDNGVEIKSSFLQNNFATAKTYCEEKLNFTACQLLGNMCVMLDYKPDSDNPCREYLNFVSSPPGGQQKMKGKDDEENANWPEYMPWLYYLNSRQDADDELNREDIAIKFETEQSLPFVLAVYAANGTFIELKMDITELQMCKDRTSKLNAANKFATLYENSCDLRVDELWQQQEMFFYDLYLKSSSNSLYAVPLVLENHESNQADSFKSWKLFRRFFLVDNLSGRPADDPDADKVIRVAEMLQINIRLRNGQGQIYPPYIKVRYKTIKINDAILEREPTVRVSFQVLYEMDTSSISRDVKVSYTVLLDLEKKLSNNRGC